MALISRVCAIDGTVKDLVKDNKIIRQSVEIESNAGRFGGDGLKFNGSNTYITINSPVTELGDFTIGMWLKSTNRVQGYECPFSTSRGAAISIFSYDSYAGGVPAFSYQISPYRRLIACKNQVDIPGKWKYYMYTRSGDTLRAFIDGVLDGTYKGYADKLNISEFNIGITPLSPSNTPFAGYIDDIAVFDTCMHTVDFPPPTGILTNNYLGYKDKSNKVYVYK